MVASAGNCQTCLRDYCRDIVGATCFAIFFPPTLMAISLVVYLSLLWWGGLVLRTMVLLYTAWCLFDSTPVRGLSSLPFTCVHTQHAMHPKSSPSSLYSSRFRFETLCRCRRLGQMVRVQIFSRFIPLENNCKVFRFPLVEIFRLTQIC